MQKKELEKWIENSDTTFKNLIMPTAFIITITWTFFFFIGEILATQDPAKFNEIFFDFYLKPFASHLTIFVTSTLFWSWSLYTKRGAEIKWLKLTTATKWLSLSFLWTSLLAVPAQVIVSAISYDVGTWAATNLYLFFGLVMVIFTALATRPPQFRRGKIKVR